MYRIVAHNPDGSELTIYDPVGAGPLPVLAPRSTEELNEAGSLEFALVVGHEAYDQLIPKGTYVTAYLDGEEFFYGRLMNPETNPLLGQIQYTCAGALSFLQDSELPADGKKSDGTIDAKTMTAEAFFRKCITHHNSDIGDDPRRKFTVGIVDHPDKAVKREYQIGSYTDTLSALRTNLLDYYGGFLRVRPDGEGGHLIDWVAQYGDTDAGTLELGTNIISMTHRVASDDLVTTVRPVGKDGLTLSTPMIDLFEEADMQRFGRIVKSVTFNNCETQADLSKAAREFIDRVHASYHIGSDIKLVDMVFVDRQNHGVRLGDVFTNIYGLEGTELLVGSRSRDFENPQNDSVSLKSPRDYDGDSSGGTYGNKKGNASSISGRSARNSAAGGYAYKYIHEFQDELQLNTKKIAINAEQLELHADQLVETANDFVRLSHRTDTLEGKVGIIEGTGVIQNSEHITSIAGKFQINPENNKVEVIQGTEFVVHDQNGATITVGNRITSLDAKADEYGNKIAAIEGSALWSQRGNIVGIVGEFDVVTAQDGTKTLRVKSGGGLKVLRNQVEYGIYDSGNLTAGLIVDKINGGTATIQAKNIILDGTTKISDVFKVSSNMVVSSQPLMVSSGEKNTTITASGVAGDTINAREHLVVGGTYDITKTIAATMIKTADKSTDGKTLTLTRFDGSKVEFSADFSGATSLSGAWSGVTAAESNSYVVTASPQGKTHTLSLSSRLNGTAQYSNFSAEVGTTDSGGNFTARVKRYGYLNEVVNGASSYVDVMTASSGGTSVARISTTATYNAGRDAIGLSDPVWNDVETVATTRTLTVSTTGKVSNISISKTVVITKGSWDSGNLPIQIRDGSSSGEIIAKSTVAVPSVSKTTWENTSDRKWRAVLTIGGTTRKSDAKDFQSVYDEGYKVTGIGVQNVTGAATAAGSSFVSGYTSVGTLAAGLRNSSFYIRFEVYTHGATFKKYIKVN